VGCRWLLVGKNEKSVTNEKNWKSVFIEPEITLSKKWRKFGSKFSEKIVILPVTRTHIAASGTIGQVIEILYMAIRVTVCFNQVLYLFFPSIAAVHYIHVFFNILFLTQPHLILVPLRSKSKVVIGVLSSRIYAYLPSTFQETTHKSRRGSRRKKKLQHLIESNGTYGSGQDTLS
jgi:hypothetical protein